VSTGPPKEHPLNVPPFRTTVAAATDLGRRRSGNEDSHSLWVAEPGEGRAADTLLVVCDGMGGSNAGEVASGMAVEIVRREMLAAPPDDPATSLARAIHTANHEIWERACAHAEMSGMGTTCTALALCGEDVFVGHVGDSRAYLVRAARARQITTDHSLVAQLVARKQITPEEAKSDPRRNVVTRSVGVGPEVDVDVVTVGEPLRDGDALVVCSDGLHGLVSDSEIAELAAEGSLEQACGALIELANARGGPDNITVALARIERPGPGGHPLRRWLRSLGGRHEG
jgi:serine/threonine protein phosphatase PrpC